MSLVQPNSEKLKKAIQWISDKKQEQPDIADNVLVDKASFNFDLSPKDSEFVMRFIKESREL